jgi:hypothetical protein
MSSVSGGLPEREGEWRENQIGDEIDPLNIRFEVGASDLGKLDIQQVIWMLAIGGVEQEHLFRESVVMDGLRCIVVSQRHGGMI